MKKWTEQEEQDLELILSSRPEEEQTAALAERFPYRTWDSIRKKVRRRNRKLLPYKDMVEGNFPAEPRKTKNLFFYPDIHFPYQDDKALAVADAICDDHNPDIIVFLGDLVDCEAPSNFPKSTSALAGLQAEYDRAQKYLEGRRDRHPNARMELLEGNHEARMKKILKLPQVRPLASLRCLQTENLMDLESLDINYTPEEEALYIANLKIIHGSVVRKKAGYTAHAELECGLSGISGHTHRMAKVWSTNEGRQIFWIEAGCLCNLKMGYTKNKMPNWQQGCVVGWIDEDNKAHLYPIEIVNGKATWNGKTYG